MEREISSGLLMFISHRAAEDRIFAALARAGFGDITRAQARLLAGIDLDGTRLVVLAERARIPKQTALALVNNLEMAGYVERSPDPSDGRARLIRLTERGRSILPVAHTEEARIEAEWQALLGARRMQALRRDLWELAVNADPGLQAPQALRAELDGRDPKKAQASVGCMSVQGDPAAEPDDGARRNPGRRASRRR